MNTTFEQIYETELARPVSAGRAMNRATVLFGFLRAMATTGKGGERRFPHTTLHRHRLALRRAGIGRVEDPMTLRAIARDLGATDRDSLTRLVWFLNCDTRRTLEGVAEKWDDLISGAHEVISFSEEPR